MRVLIRGAGDLASGIALRLHRAGLDVVMTDLEKPTAIRRTVCFSQALVLGAATVEDVTARAAASAAQAEEILAAGEIPVLADPACTCREALRPDALVDAILAKRNLGMRIGDAPVVIGVGPGFTAGEDCHAVVETMRGHTLGRVIYRGSAIPNTNIPGLIGGFAGERVLRAPADGVFHRKLEIGARVEPGDIAGEVAGLPMRCMIGGVLRGNFSCFDMSMAIMPAFVLSTVSIASNLALAIWGVWTGGSILIALQSLGQMLLSMYLTLFVIGAITTVTERRHIHTGRARRVLYAFTFPLFMFTYLPISLAALFSKGEWKPIEHRVSAASLRSSGRSELLPF